MAGQADAMTGVGRGLAFTALIAHPAAFQPRAHQDEHSVCS
jgi:hypothetical protein